MLDIINYMELLSFHICVIIARKILFKKDVAFE